MSLSLMLVAATASVALGGEKQFGYVYEPLTLPPGQVELEQWVTPRLGKAGGVYSEFDLRTEIEVGIIDNLQTSLYLNLNAVHASNARSGPRGSGFLSNDAGSSDYSDLEFDGISNETIYKFLDPVADPIGFAAYVEWETNGAEFEIEEKLLFSKTWGGLTVAMNWIFEQDWRSHSNEPNRALHFDCTLGVAYKIPGTPLGIGLEFRSENTLDFYDRFDHSVFSLGPNVHFATQRFWATLTLMPQLASATPSYKSYDYDGYEVLEARLICGIEF